jgi:hypothetical protein
VDRKYPGVSETPHGRFTSSFKANSKAKLVYLGAFDTPEQAALARDLVVIGTTALQPTRSSPSRTMQLRLAAEE